MIYGHIPDWMREENAAFARAVEYYYSIEHGQRKAAVKGELALWQVAEKVADRHPSAPLYSLGTSARMRRAVHEGDENYLHSLRECVRLSRKSKPDNEENPPMIEHIFEAYYFLRKRDGKGSPLPTKAEVKKTAAIIAAFHEVRLTAKLHDFLWHHRGLTEKQFERVVDVREQLLDERSHHWPRRLAEGGLADLPQKRGKN
jgi:hypothetical protein